MYIYDALFSATQLHMTVPGASAEQQPLPLDLSSLTVLIVSYQSRANLERCLPTLLRQPGAPPQVLVVDNHGADGVASWLAADWPEVEVVANSQNSGYAGGNNVGLRYVKTPYTLILNPDTEVLPGTLLALLEVAQRHSDALITPKLLRPDGKVNACGNEMHYTGMVWCLGIGEHSEHFHGLHEVPLISGAAILTSTATLRALGGFDERYFMYHEDTDLSLRARLAGYRLLCLADYGIVHYYTLGLTPSKLYYLERNRLITLYKVLQPATLRQLLPALLLTEAATWAYAARGGAYLRARWSVYRWLWSRRAELRSAHAAAQQGRQISDAELLSGAQVALPLGQVAGGAATAVQALTTPLYRLLRPAALRRSV